MVLFQAPNLPLWGWIICRTATKVFSDTSFVSGLSSLGTAFIFTWAYLELTAGVNYFRRTLGAVILGLTIMSFFTR